jgi:SUN domain-containing protein 1/2
MPPSPDYLLLSTFTYDPALPNHIQTFPVDSAIQALGIDMGIVVFKFASNWGGDFTCLYRVSQALRYPFCAKLIRPR